MPSQPIVRNRGPREFFPPNAIRQFFLEADYPCEEYGAGPPIHTLVRTASLVVTETVTLPAVAEALVTSSNPGPIALPTVSSLDSVAQPTIEGPAPSRPDIESTPVTSTPARPKAQPSSNIPQAVQSAGATPRLGDAPGVRSEVNMKPPFPTSTPSSGILPVFTLDGKTYTADSSGTYTIDDRILTPGGTITLPGPSATNGFGDTPAGKLGNDNEANTNIGSDSVSSGSDTDDGSAKGIPGANLNGEITISLSQDGKEVVINGIPQAVDYKPLASGSPVGEAGAVITINGKLYTADGEGKIVVDGRTSIMIRSSSSDSSGVGESTSVDASTATTSTSSAGKNSNPLVMLWALAFVVMLL